MSNLEGLSRDALKARVEAAERRIADLRTGYGELLEEREIKNGQLAALRAAQEWQDISTAPNDSYFRWYGLHVLHRSGHSWFEAHYVQHDDDGEMRSPSGDNFSDWAFSDFEVWCNAPPPPVAVIAEERGTNG